jgi:hypothetical protein
MKPNHPNENAHNLTFDFDDKIFGELTIRFMGKKQ